MLRRWLGPIARNLLTIGGSLFPRRASISPRRKVGVFLYWGIGDAVLTLPLLQALRAALPDAELVAFGKEWAAELLQDEAIFDRVERFVPPWTRHLGKYRLWSAEWRHFFGATMRVRREAFDLLISLRPDPRDLVLARWLGSREFAGIAGEGGKAWVTIDIGASFAEPTRIYGGRVAAEAASLLFGRTISPKPKFKHPPSGSIGLDGMARPILAIAFGASHGNKRWDGAAIGAVVANLRQPPGSVVIIDHDDSPNIALPAGLPTRHWRGSLTQLKILLRQVDLLFCADSGVMHIGAALDRPLVALFSSGLPARFAPLDQRIYAVEPMPCRPCGDHCIHRTRLCLDRIEPAQLTALLDDALQELR